MAKLTDDVEAELQRRMEVWDTMAQDAAERLGQILPIADSLGQKLGDMESLLSNDLVSSVRETAVSAEEGAQASQALQKLLSILVKTVLESNSELAFAYEQSVELESSQLQTADLASRQEALERGLSQLEGMAQTLFSDFDAHSRLLVQANNMTNDMLDTLEATAAATSTIQNSFRGYREMGGWWPYIVCPALSLVMGSYGLPPSILRNIGLFTLGELAGAMVSFHNHLETMADVLFTFSGMAHNTTRAVF
ncbi:hypothetical protein Sste5344_000827 [Sporothrix stenoceras]